MDYIIFGVGAGATLVLIGWLFREIGPWLRDRRPAEDEILSAHELVTRMAWTRFCATCGMALVFCGVLILALTGIVTLLSPSDDQGAMAVLIAFGLAPLLMVIWSALYLRQFGALGVLRPKPKTTRSAQTPVATSPATAPEIGPTLAPTALTPEKSFAEAAASPGGIGRFSAFFRRDSGEGKTTDSVVPGETTETTTTSPTEVVIAHLAGGSTEESDKRLEPDDLLVTSEMGTVGQAANADIEELLVTDVLGTCDSQATSEDSPLAADGASVDPEGPDVSDAAAGVDQAVSSDTPDADLPAREAALDSLRRRRIERLTKGGSSS